MENDYGTFQKRKVSSLLEKGAKKDQPKKDCGCVNKCPHTISNSVGEMVINVYRKTYALTVALPYPIWGSLYVDQNNFATALTPYIPVTVPPITVTSVITPAGNITLTYTNGTETDEIEITVPSIGLISYVEFLQALKTTYLKSCFCTFDCNSANDAGTLDNSVILGLQSEGLFINKVGATGDKGGQLIIPKSRRQINNSVMNIIEIYLRNEEVKPDSVWVHSFPYYVYGSTSPSPHYSWTVYFSDSVDMNKKL